jgi:NTP pyrophosphatase (non-canonical NTP hydrolase)
LSAPEIAPPNALADVIEERFRQHKQWGDQSQHPDTTWLAILTEEVGECAQAALHNGFGGKARGTLREELVQVAAVAVAWIDAIDKRGQDYV